MNGKIYFQVDNDKTTFIIDFKGDKWI
jgi:hypothetical protein